MHSTVQPASSPSAARRSLHLVPQPDREQHFHTRLARFNERRLDPVFVRSEWQTDLRAEFGMRVEEGNFVESERAKIQAFLTDVPVDAGEFMSWLENLRSTGPGQGDPLFPWLAEDASEEEMCWFLTQEAAGEAGFEDLVAMSQVKIPTQAKLEMARNYWDEMGRGHERGMHGPMLANAVRDLSLKPRIETTVWESLALANLMVALAANRRYAYQSIGALGVIEMTAPGRVSLINQGLLRLRAPTSARMYFQLHAGLDIEHSKAWNAEVFHSLVAADPLAAQPLAEGALMRLSVGARCFKRYRQEFGLTDD